MNPKQRQLRSGFCSSGALKILNPRAIKTTLGTYYYQGKRYLEWHLIRKQQYATTFNYSFLPHVAFKHSTPLLRPLKNVDPWMQRNKVRNLGIAISRINGVVIHPGETFSYWRLIGKPTRRKGYVDGMVLWHGRVITGIGGGLCQLSNLIYWMALHTSLTVTERYRHDYDVFPDADRAVPFGSGATCYFNYIDLQIFNGTSQAYQLKLDLTGEALVGEWRTEQEQDYSYKVYQKEHLITHEYGCGYVRHNTIYRRVYGPDKTLIDDQFVTENHAIMMYQPFLTEGRSK